MKIILAELLVIIALTGCGTYNYAVPPNSNLSSNKEDIMQQRRICESQAFDSFHAQYGYIAPALGSILGGAIAGPIGGAAGGSVYGSTDESRYLEDYQKKCMTDKGYIIESTR